MSQRKSLGIALTKQDKEIIEWANMLRSAGQSPRTWIQALLAAHFQNIPIDIGGVHLSTEEKKIQSTSYPFLFGDDTQTETDCTCNYSWSTRGPNKEFIVGSIISISIRPTLNAPIEALKKKKINCSCFVKALLKKNIRKLPSGPNELPDANQLMIILPLFEYNQTDTIFPTKERNLEDNHNIKSAKDDTSIEQLIPDTQPSEKSSASPQKQKNRNPLLGYIS